MRERAMSRLNRPDYAVMRRFNNWHAPRWVQSWMLAATRAGDGYLWILVSIGILLSGEAGRYRATSCALLAAVVSILVFQQVKKLVGRRRPCEIEPHCWADLLPPDQFSFPSGHTMTAFAFTFALEPFFPGTFGPLLFCSANIGASRVLLGMHFLSDVVVGAFLGALIGQIVRAVLL